MTIHQAWLPDAPCQQSRELADCLAACNVAVVDAPERIVAAVLEKCPGAKTVTPGRIRTAIRKTKGFQEALEGKPLEARKQVRRCDHMFAELQTGELRRLDAVPLGCGR